MNYFSSFTVKVTVCLAGLAGLAGVLPGTGYAAELCTVPAELWDRPRTGKAVLAQATIKPCIAAFAQRPLSRLVIHHGVTAEQLLLAEELRAWLAALALDIKRMDLASVANMKSSDPLSIEIKAAK